jgi:hypothetical protein
MSQFSPGAFSRRKFLLATPLIIAQEKRFFARHGMTNVQVAKQASWGSAQDNWQSVFKSCALNPA